MIPPPPKRTDWVSGGVPYFIETEKQDGESDERWEERHAAAVTFWQGVHTPD